MPTISEKKAFLDRVRKDWYEVMRPFGGWSPSSLSQTTVDNQDDDENYFKHAPELLKENLVNCKVVPNRLTLLTDCLPKQAVVAEVGTDTGWFAEKIIETSMPSELHLVDINMKHIRRKIHEGGLLADSNREGVLKIHEADSAKALSQFPSAYFDWIYIDAQHTYEGVKRDIEQSKAALKPDGLLVFNDYIYWSHLELMPYGVVQAVNELCLSEGWEIIYITLCGHMYNDVVLRKI